MISIVIYVDVVFCVNGIINYILLILTAKICDISVSRPKAFFAAVLGALYSVIEALCGFKYTFLRSAAIKFSAGVLMILTAYGKERRFVRVLGVFFLISMFFAGAIMAITTAGGGENGWRYETVSLKVLFLSFAILYFLLSLFYRRSERDLNGGGVSEIEVTVGTHKAKFKALHDTGNSLSDPISGNHVIITDIPTVQALFSGEIMSILTGELLKKPVQAAEQLYTKDNQYKFRLIPYRVVGKERGFLLGLKPDVVYVDKKARTDIIIALSPNKVSSGENYSALMRGETI